MRILFVTPETAPYCKTGGLADFSSALPDKLAERGHEVVVVTPRHSGIDVATFDLRRKRVKLSVTIRGKTIQGGILEGQTPNGVTLWFVDQPGYFERQGIYGREGKPHPDNDERFAYFCRATLEACRQTTFAPDIIHANDWPTGPLAPLLQFEYRDRPELNACGTVFTAHNLAHAGLFDPDAMMTLGLPWDLFTPDEMEFFGKVSYLKAGLVFADKLTTVSPRYAAEIQTAEFGRGFESLMRDRAEDLRGILNGVDNRVWNPQTDPHIPSPFDQKNMEGKTEAKAQALQHAGLPLLQGQALVSMVCPMTEQKGIDLLLEAAEGLMHLDCQFILAGRGDPKMEADLRDLADAQPHRVAYLPDCDEACAHRIMAGSDLWLMPSRFEPCGLTQMQAMLYGTIPLVHATGGLADTVDDPEDDPEDATGFTMPEASADALLAGLKRSLAAFSEKVIWRRMQENAMGLEFSWNLVARRYEAIYKAAAELRS
ncbi:MAG: glycogen synthase [Deltaproteobacteria bacterium]|nr:glycogen synthase [Deltaproteobacteria bacterium]